VSNWFALLYKLQPGSEEAVEKLFQESGRPDHVVLGTDGEVQGKLLRTLAFVGKEMAVRVLEYEGDLRSVSAHVSRQPVVQEFERRVQEHLAVPRDLSNPAGAAAFFQEWGLRCVLNRLSDE
jgi:hypothetical protein